MSESARVQRWRQRMREEGKAPMTLWLTTAEKQWLEDLARQRHCTPAELVQEAIVLVYATPGTVTDTEQLRSVADTVTDTTSKIVTATVTATIRQELPLLVRMVVEELRLQGALAVSDTATDTLLRDVTDTVTATRDDASAPGVSTRVTATHTTVTDTVTVTSPSMEPSSVADTVSATDSAGVSVTVTDTMTPPPFDPARFRLGKLCIGHHDYHGTGQTLYRLPKMVCPQCDATRVRDRRAAKRQTAAR